MIIPGVGDSHITKRHGDAHGKFFKNLCPVPSSRDFSLNCTPLGPITNNDNENDNDNDNGN